MSFWKKKIAEIIFLVFFPVYFIQIEIKIILKSWSGRIFRRKRVYRSERTKQNLSFTNIFFISNVNIYCQSFFLKTNFQLSKLNETCTRKRFEFRPKWSFPSSTFSVDSVHIFICKISTFAFPFFFFSKSTFTENQSLYRFTLQYCPLDTRYAAFLFLNCF